MKYENQFVQKNDAESIVGGNNTISVGLDLSSLSSWSWLSRPLRITNTLYYMIEEGQGSYLTFPYDSARYDERFGNPKMMPPKKVVV